MTVYLDRRFRQVGRIKKAAGTEHKKTIRQLDEMLTGLFERGRLDILRSIQKGQYTPLQVWEYYRIGELHKLPTAATLSPLEASMKDWADDKECSESHRLSLHQSIRHLACVARKDASIAELPEILEALRTKLKAAKHARSFNLAKTAAQGFVRTKLKKNHPLYFAVSAVEGLKVKPQREGNPLTPDDLYALTADLEPDPQGIALAMAYTGMGWTEYMGRWELKADRVVIHGTKRKGRDRFVPRINSIAHHEMTYKAFREALAAMSKEQNLPLVRPYDLRRTYANWLEGAGIPRTRRKLYMGHGASDVTDLYERHEVERFLVEDGERLTAFIGATDRMKAALELLA